MPERPTSPDQRRNDALQAHPQRQILSVSELNRAARMTIEQRFSQIWVSGELSSFARPSSGHWYFTLKDRDAQVRCAMFANANRRARMQPANGQQVLLRGRVSLYEGRGEFQIIVEHMEPAGEGALRAAFEALKRQLNAEGLFDSALKRPLPDIPTRVAVVTSPTGAALEDVLSVWRRRFPALEVIVVPTAVQGADAEGEILRALERAQRLDADLILLTRGGGSMEDLWVFNAESIARAIAATDIPVVSAIGHEIDVSISDFVADLRAPTPSAAAELIAPDGEELGGMLLTQQRRLRLVVSAALRERKLQADKLTLGLINPARYCQQAAQRLDELQLRLLRVATARQHQQQAKLESLNIRLAAKRPDRLLANLNQRLNTCRGRLQQLMQYRLQRGDQQVVAAARMLESLSPLPTLARGYTVLRDIDGTVISQVAQLQSGQQLHGQMQDGGFTATVTATRAGETLTSVSPSAANTKTAQSAATGPATTPTHDGPTADQ